MLLPSSMLRVRVVIVNVDSAAEEGVSERGCMTGKGAYLSCCRRRR